MGGEVDSDHADEDTDHARDVPPASHADAEAVDAESQSYVRPSVVGTRKRGRPSKASGDQLIYETLVQYYGLLGMAVYPVNAYDAEVITSRSQQMAAGWMVLGAKYPEVYRVLKLMTSGGPIMAVAMPHIAVCVAIGANHDMLPRAWVRGFGMEEPPRTLHSSQPSAKPSPTATPPPTYNSPPVATGMPSPSTGGMNTSPSSIPTGLSPEQIEQYKQLAIAQALAAQGQMLQQTPGYQPQDTTFRPEQNPAATMGLIDRR